MTFEEFKEKVLNRITDINCFTGEVFTAYEFHSCNDFIYCYISTSLENSEVLYLYLLSNKPGYEYKFFSGNKEDNLNEFLQHVADSGVLDG